MAKLEGITKISRYMNRSDSTILDLIRSAGFPATRTKASVWVADTHDIDKWRENQDKPVEKPRPVVVRSKRGTIKSTKK
jgi:hypothetical protein